MEYLHTKAIVIDNGSCYLKIGFEGDQLPIAHIPNLTGIVAYTGPCGVVNGTPLVGYEVINEEADYLVYPVRDGTVENWESLEHMYNHLFLRTFAVDTTRHAFVVVDSPFNDYQSRQKMAELLFDKFNIGALSICDQAITSLKFAGRQHGLVVDCGGSGTNVIPVYNGRTFMRAAQRISVGGDTVTRVLMKYMMHRDYNFQTLKDISAVNDIKANLCFVADKFWKQLSRDLVGGSAGRGRGRARALGEERYVAGEALFRPSWAIENGPGIYEAIAQSITACPAMIQASMLSNVVLCGGTSLLRGFPQRVAKELRRYRQTYDVKVVSLPHREAAAWIGASTMAAQIKWSPSLISKEQYQENGPKIIRKMFI